LQLVEQLRQRAGERNRRVVESMWDQNTPYLVIGDELEIAGRTYQLGVRAYAYPPGAPPQREELFHIWEHDGEGVQGFHSYYGAEEYLDEQTVRTYSAELTFFARRTRLGILSLDLDDRMVRSATIDERPGAKPLRTIIPLHNEPAEEMLVEGLEAIRAYSDRTLNNLASAYNLEVSLRSTVIAREAASTTLLTGPKGTALIASLHR
jgi:hypothetical protein